MSGITLSTSGISTFGVTSKVQNNTAHIKIVEIASGNSPNQVPNPDLEDDQKRWLVVGICLHSVISPALRQYIPPVVTHIYSKLKQSHQINTQTYPKYMKHYKPTNHELNYEAINNNKAIPKIKGQKDIRNYDYTVSSEVDLTKLFMMTSMAHFTGFDDTCDLSALLGIIINIDSYQSHVKQVAEKVRSDVRNTWAHCNFSEWDMIKFQNSFQLMRQLIMNLQLPRPDETALVGKLTNWLTNGVQFVEGNTLGLHLLNDLKTETAALGRYVLDVVSCTDESLKDIHKAVTDIESALDLAKNRIQNLEKNHEQIKGGTEDLQVEVTTIYERTSKIETKQEEDRKLLEDSQHASSCLQDDVNATKHKIDSIESAQKDMETDISRNKTDIQAIKKYFSETRPKDKIFFYTPNRIKTFVGREDELEQLEKDFCYKTNDHHTKVLCGLGGIGKTTLSIEYAWRYLKFYPGGVFWMSAESNEALEDSLQRLAIDINTVGTDRKETVHRTLKWISALQDRWLLVVDNVDMEEIRGTIKGVLLGPWKRNSRGHIIITSRREATRAEEDFGIGLENFITLDALSMPVSVNFMLSRAGPKDVANDDSLQLLVKELGGLPLALEQAAAHIRILKCTFKEYLDRFNRKRLKLLKASNQLYDMPKERQTVRTTWQLNFEYIAKQSDEEGLGSAAVSVMEILAFLYADDIPIDVLNTGSPKVTDNDLLDGLQDSVGVKQSVEILTSFSLFQWVSCDTVSVHRLVQEVIRENIKDVDCKNKILRDAVRMINKALEKTHTISEVLESKNIDRMSLQTWNKVALHATTLKDHIFEFTGSNPNFHLLCVNVETCNILHASAIYHSLYQRQGEALACQDQMLSILTALDIHRKDYQYLTRIKIPLLSTQRVVIQRCIAVALGSVSASTGGERSVELLDSETLREKGNEYFKMKKFNESIQCFSEAISIRKDNVDTIILSNRSQAFLEIGDFENALRDAERCIQLNPTAWKSYCLKAYAIANMIRLSKLSESWESIGLASAAVAGHLKEQCLFEYRMKIEYPVVCYKIVEDERQLEIEITSLLHRTYTTLLLRKGCYNVSYGALFAKSVQIIGIDDEVDICCDGALKVVRPSKSWFSIDFKVEDQINIHFENVCFPSKSSQVYVGEGAHVTFYRCTFSNGKKGCPSCPGIAVVHGGQAFVESCMMDRCGAGGILCEGAGSFISVQKSTIKNMNIHGVDARFGGRAHVENCEIFDNQLHGVSIGPSGFGIVKDCTIQSNKGEGIWCGHTFLKGMTKEKNTVEGSVCEIKDNLICQNGMCGISLNGGSFDLSGNMVFENWLWGILLRSRSTAYISNNDIFENKCGGIRIGLHYSSSVILHGNSVRDHTGPGLHKVMLEENSVQHFLYSQNDSTEPNIPYDEVTAYTSNPLVTTRNVFKDNDKGLEDPKHIYALVQTCCYCHNVSVNLKLCTKCRKASYCSKQCQRSHWKRHKIFCCLLHDTYTIEIDMSETETDVSEPLTLELAAEQRKGESPDITGKKKFIVKIQSGEEYTRFDPDKKMKMYDQTRGFEILFRNSQLYYLLCECGVLGATQYTTKKIYCWASFKNFGKQLCIFTENLPPLQKW